VKFVLLSFALLIGRLFPHSKESCYLYPRVNKNAIYISREAQPRRNVLVTHVCVSVCVSHTTFPHYCTDPDVTSGMVGVPPSCALLDLQSVHGFRCCDNIAPNAKCQRVLVLALCLVTYGRHNLLSVVNVHACIGLPFTVPDTLRCVALRCGAARGAIFRVVL